ncbi:MAG: ABC transporter substrate-binding protein [Chloroflexi bacterium]|nr:ABC transporter substrate-binding protein [Chloroflexota bacterium]
MHPIVSHSRGRPTRVAVLALALALALLVQAGGPLLAWAAPAAQGTITVTDVVGRTVTVKAPVQRVILAEGRQTYIVASLDTDNPFQRVVAWGDDLRTADYDTYVKYGEKFPSMAEIPVMGSPQSGTFSVEKAVSLQPDLVLFSLDSYAPARDSGLIDTLAGVGIPSVIIDFRQQPLETTVPSILLVGRLFGREANAQAVADFYTQQVNTVFARVEKIKDAPPTIFILRAAGLLDCCGTFGRANLGILAERAGGTNIAAGLFPGWSGTVNPEKVLTADPDIIIATGSNWVYSPNAQNYVPFGYNTTPEMARTALRGLTDQPGWSGLKAVKTGRFYGVWHQFYNSPFHFAVLQQFAKWNFPEQFADIDPEANLRTYHERFLPISYGGTFWVGLND